MAAEVSVKFSCKSMNLQHTMDRSSKSLSDTFDVSKLICSIAAAALHTLTDDLMTSAAVT